MTEPNDQDGTHIPLSGHLPDFIQGPPISRVCAPKITAANIVPPGGKLSMVVRGGEIVQLLIHDAKDQVTSIVIETATPQEIMEVYAHLQYEVEQACLNFRKFGAIAAKAHAELSAGT